MDSSDSFTRFCFEKQDNGFVLHRDTWRKRIRRLAIERRAEKKLDKELESAGFGKKFTVYPTDTKLKILLLEDVFEAMRGRTVKLRTFVHRTETDILRRSGKQVDNRGSNYNGSFPHGVLELCTKHGIKFEYIFYDAYRHRYGHLDIHAEHVKAWEWLETLGIFTTREALEEERNKKKGGVVVRSTQTYNAGKFFTSTIITERQQDES